MAWLRRRSARALRLEVVFAFGRSKDRKRVYVLHVVKIIQRIVMCWGDLDGLTFAPVADGHNSLVIEVRNCGPGIVKSSNIGLAVLLMLLSFD